MSNNNRSHHHHHHRNHKRDYTTTTSSNGGDNNSSTFRKKRNYKKRKFHSDPNTVDYSQPSSSSNNNNNNNNNQNADDTFENKHNNYNKYHPFAIRNLSDYLLTINNNNNSSSSSSTTGHHSDNTTTTSSPNSSNSSNSSSAAADTNNQSNSAAAATSQNVMRNYYHSKTTSNSSSKFRKIPKGWPQITPLLGELIPNTPFIPLKCPLSPQLFKYPNNVSLSLLLQEHFTPTPPPSPPTPPTTGTNTDISAASVASATASDEENREQFKEIGMLIDLCCVEFYKQNDIPPNVKHFPFYMNVHDLNRNLHNSNNNTSNSNNNSAMTIFEEQMNSLIDSIDSFTIQNPSKLILIHCTHGLNRTGFVICYYLLKKGIVPCVEQAIELFKKHRLTTTGLYNPFFIDLLFEMFNQTESEMYQLMKYPEPVSHSRKSIRSELKQYKPWLKRRNCLECVNHYGILKSIVELQQQQQQQQKNNNEQRQQQSEIEQMAVNKGDLSKTDMSNDEEANSSGSGSGQSSGSDREEEEELEEIDDEELTRKYKSSQ